MSSDEIFKTVVFILSLVKVFDLMSFLFIKSKYLLVEISNNVFFNCSSSKSHKSSKHSSDRKRSRDDDSRDRHHKSPKKSRR